MSKCRNASSHVDNIVFFLQETHIIHKFDEDFYGAELSIVVLGYLRPEKNYPSLGKSTSQFIGVTDDAAVDSSLFNDTTQQPASVI